MMLYVCSAYLALYEHTLPNTRTLPCAALDDLVAAGGEPPEWRDRLSYHVDCCIDAFEHITHNMRSRIVHENAMLPLYRVREVNSAGIAWLSRQSGKTIREKLARNRSMLAVQRRMSLDTGENRLFVAFLKEMTKLMKIRAEYLPEEFWREKDRRFLKRAERFLEQEEVREIARWQNTPPNNTLLSDRYYGCVWREWKKLQALDQLIRADSESFAWSLLYLFVLRLIRALAGSCRFPQVPVNLSPDLSNEEFCLCPVFGDPMLLGGMDTQGKRLVVQLDPKAQQARVVGACGVCRIGIRDMTLLFCCGDQEMQELPLTPQNFDRTAELASRQIVAGAQAPDAAPARAETGRQACVDLFEIRPDYCLDDAEPQQLDCRLLMQYQSSENHTYAMDCSRSGILFFRRTKTCTVASCVDNDGKDLDDLVEILSRRLKTKQIRVVYPDLYNDFQLSDLYRSLRQHYSRVEFFPRSVGILFSGHRNLHALKQLGYGDCVMVVDRSGGICAATLLRKQELENHPGAAVWERYPTFTQTPDEEQTLRARLAELLQTDPGGLPDFRLDWLALEQKRLAMIWVREKTARFSGTQTRLCPVDESMVSGLKNSVDLSDWLNGLLESSRHILGDAKVQIVFTDDTMRYTKWSPRVSFITMAPCSCAVEGEKRYRAAELAAGSALWKDHLPDLAIERMHGVYQLVQNATVLPQFGREQLFAINQEFILPKNGASVYRFTLIKGDSASTRKKINYEAVIRSPAFPLKEDVRCTLRMSYRFGEEHPYRLLFIPRDPQSAGFRSVEVEWQKAKKLPCANMIYPEFREKTWQELQKQKDKNGNEKDLLEDAAKYLKEWACLKYFLLQIQNPKAELVFKYSWKKPDEIQKMGWICRDGSTIYGLLLFPNTINKRNLFDDFRQKQEKGTLSNSVNLLCYTKKWQPENRLQASVRWRNGRKGWYSCQYISELGRKLRFPEQNFMFQDTFSPEIENVTFTTRPLKPYANDILPDIPVSEVYTCRDDQRIQIKRLFYCLYQIFQGKKKLSDPDCPQEFRETIKHTVPLLMQKYETLQERNSEMEPEKFERHRLFRALCMLSEAADDAFYRQLMEKIQKGSSVGHSQRKWDLQHCGYALHDCSREREKQLLDVVVHHYDAKTRMDVLSTAAWQNPDFITNLDWQTLQTLLKELLTDLAVLLGRNNLSKDETFRRDRSMEFLLACFRLRQKHDSELDETLSLNNPLLRKVYDKLNEDLDKKDRCPVRSRLHFNIKQSPEYQPYHIPAFEYAMLTYITGIEPGSGIQLSVEYGEEKNEDED